MNPLYMVGVYFVWFLSTYYVVFFFLVLFTSKEKLYQPKIFPNSHRPLVSVIVPAFNEEGKIKQTIASLKKATYKKIEFIVVNDGSSDGTSKEVRAAIGKDKRFRFIDRKENRGKAASLNEGIAQARGEFVAGMDADSVIQPDMFEKTLPYFRDKDVGSVTVTVEVLKTNTFLSKIVDLEFIIGLSLFLKVFSFFNCVFVTPGPFSLYRKTVVDEIGGFDVDNITEDLEIAYRIHKAGYRIANCMEAKVYTIVPPTFKEVYVQRRRWYSGALQTLMKHRNLILNKKFGLFGFFIPFNYALIFCGMLLFYASTYLLLSNVGEYVWNLRHTGINVIQNLAYFELDLLRLGRVSLVGYTALLMTFVILYFGIKYTRHSYREKKLGIVGYPLLFFLYQIFWAGAVLSVIRGKKVKWR